MALAVLLAALPQDEAKEVCNPTCPAPIIQNSRQATVASTELMANAVGLF
jgi:hypothetical protein